MLHRLSSILERPPLYAETQVAFWNDEYISKQMLEAHLDPNFEGASRKLDFIEISVEWIKEIVPPSDYPLLLDVGCGPGIYAEKFSKMGYQVTGIDYSKRSIDYAKKLAMKENLAITYYNQDYLRMELNKKFDFAVMIYCDYGALSLKNRRLILEKIYHHLKPGGKFLFDVFSMKKYKEFLQNQSWECCPNGGFWRSNEYITLNGYYKYPENVTLEQIAVISDIDTAVYYLWNTYFTDGTLLTEATAAGFKLCGLFSDVTGTAYDNNSDTIAILLEK